MKNLGQIIDYLGISVKIDYSKGTINLNQTAYIKKVLAKFGMLDCKLVYTLMDSKIKLISNTSKASIEDIKWF